MGWDVCGVIIVCYKDYFMGLKYLFFEKNSFFR
jgi:hypothetical protein